MGLDLKKINFDFIIELGVVENMRLDHKNELTQYRGGVARETKSSISSVTNNELVKKFIDNKENFFKDSIDLNNLTSAVIGKNILLYKDDIVHRTQILNALDTHLTDIPKDYLANYGLGNNTFKVKGKTIRKRRGIDTGQMAESIGIEIKNK